MGVPFHFRLFQVGNLSVLDDADLGGAENTAVKQEALLLGVEAGAILLVGHGRLEDGLVDVGVELLALGGGVEALETVLLEGGDEDVVGHLEAIVKGDKVLVLGGELSRLDGGERAVEVVNGLDEVAGEALERKVLGGLDLALRALLEVAVVCDGAKVLVLHANKLLWPCR